MGAVKQAIIGTSQEHLLDECLGQRPADLAVAVKEQEQMRLQANSQQFIHKSEQGVDWHTGAPCEQEF